MIHHLARALAVREAALCGAASSAQATPPSLVPQRLQQLRIRRDPNDARRTVITGRFADVCAALDRMVAAEPEAAC